MRSAVTTCERCGGLPGVGSRRQKSGRVGERDRTVRVPHVEGDRHRRQTLLTTEARAGWILAPGSFWERGQQPAYALGRWALDWYYTQRDGPLRGGRCGWSRGGGVSVPGGSLYATWLQLDPVEEALPEMRRWAEDQERAHHTIRAELLGRLCTAGRAVERVGVPWWRAVRDHDLVPYLPAWLVS